MKSAPLGLAGCQEWSLTREALPVDGDRMTTLIHYERQRWKKVNFFAKKPLPRSLLQHVQTLCMPSFIDLHTHATPGMWRRLLAVETLPIDRWHARTTGEDLRGRSIAIDVKHETLPANRTRLLAAPVATASRSTGMRHAVSAAMAIVLKISTVIIWSWLVKCTTTKDPSRKRAVMAEG